MTEEDSQFPLDLKRKWKAPELHFEFMWLSMPTLFKEVHATFRITKNLELVAVGDDVYKDANYRVLTLVFREVKKPNAVRRAFSLKKEWELTDKGFQTLDTIKKESDE